MITLYQVEWCPWCHRVRQALTELELTYTIVNVPAKREARSEVIELSGQAVVPVLKDGDTVIYDSAEIIRYLRGTYPHPDDMAEHESKGRLRVVRRLDVAPREAVSRLQDALAREGMQVVCRKDGERIAAGLPDGYVLLQASMPAVTKRVVEADPSAASGATVAIAVYPADGGSEVAAADPMVGVWVFGEPELIKSEFPLKARVRKVIADL